MAARNKTYKPKKVSSTVNSTKNMHDILTEINKISSALDPKDKVLHFRNHLKEHRNLLDKDVVQSKRFKDFEYMVQEGYEQNEKEMFNDVMENKMMSMLGFKDRSITRTDDGDQSQVKGMEAMKIKQYWASGLDWAPENPLVSSSWMRVLSFGDYDGMMLHIEEATKLSEPHVSTLLERRETMLNFSALHHVVKGAMHYSEKKSENPPKHIECLRKLIELGANIEAKDFAGFTPLFYCVTKFATNTSLKLAKILLSNGANVNAQNRIGSTPLAEPVMARRLDCMQLLLERGADPTIRDNDGATVEGGMMSCFDTGLKKLFVEARNRKTRELRDKAKKDAGGDLNQCNVCSTPSDVAKPNKRCKGCYMIYYCDADCQKSDWRNHKVKCKETRKQYKEIVVYSHLDSYVNTDYTKSSPIYKDIKSKSSSVQGHFTVKVQIPFDDSATLLCTPQEEATLSAYNQDKTFYIQISEKDEMYPILYKTIRDGGVFGDKGFFHAISEVKDKKRRIMLNPTLLPPEVW